MKTHLLTFAGGGRHWSLAGRRLYTQARVSGLFESVRLCTPRTLATDPEWDLGNRDFVARNSRGFGYWLWKPFLIGQALKYLPRGDVLLYLDAGCDLNLREEKPRQRLGALSQLANDQGLAVFTTTHKLLHWTKRDVLDAFGLSEGYSSRADQHEACVLFFSADPETSSLVNQWYETCRQGGFRLIDDSPSHSNEYRGFIEHRHDQAILSSLLHAQGFPQIPREHWFNPYWQTLGRDFPIWATRNFGPYPTSFPLGTQYQQFLWRARGHLRYRQSLRR
jgi:hypothetical protein